MSAVPDIAASTDETAFAANRAWELDRAAMLQQSERRGWIVAGIGVLLAVLSVMAVFAQGPLRQVIGIPIVVDKITGETTIQQRLSVESVPVMEALDKHHLTVFVRAREGYAWWFLQRDFDQVARMAVPSVFADYNRQFEGETAVQKKLAGGEEWRIIVVGVRLSLLDGREQEKIFVLPDLATDRVKQVCRLHSFCSQTNSPSSVIEHSGSSLSGSDL